MRSVAPTAIACLLLAVLTPCLADQTSERKRVLEELDGQLLGSQGPLKLDGDRGWRAVVMAPPGTPLGALLTPFASLATDSVDAPRLLEAANTYDRPLAVANGIGAPGAASLSEVWELVLARTHPNYIRLAETLEDDPDVSILFRQSDPIDRARGITYQREPSEAVARYREFEDSLRNLAAEEINRTGLWRLNSRLARYGSIQEAKSALIEDWLTYGFKREVDSARTALAVKLGSQRWLDWVAADAAYKASLISVTPEMSVPRTVLFPSPAEWLNGATWLRARGGTSDPNVIVSYEVAPIRIIRTWFVIDSLVSGKLRFQNLTGSRQIALSDGTTPTSMTFPAGIMAVIPESLLLVRNIKFLLKASLDKAAPVPPDHPLGTFAYPDAINLFGYIARTLPRIVN